MAGKVPTRRLKFTVFGRVREDRHKIQTEFRNLNLNVPMKFRSHASWEWVSCSFREWGFPNIPHSFLDLLKEKNYELRITVSE